MLHANSLVLTAHLCLCALAPSAQLSPMIIATITRWDLSDPGGFCQREYGVNESIVPPSVCSSKQVVLQLASCISHTALLQLISY